MTSLPCLSLWLVPILLFTSQFPTAPFSSWGMNVFYGAWLCVGVLGTVRPHSCWEGAKDREP